MRMKVSYSINNDSSSSCCDLLCNEEAETLSDQEIIMPEYTHQVECYFPEDSNESIAEFIEGEASYSPANDYLERFRSSSLDSLARQNSVSWILKVQAFYHFQPLTAYLAVNYMDRFLSSHTLPQVNGWPLQLLAVSCLSLAAKMEETHVPSLVDLQVEDAKFVFESRIIRRMELLVLTALKWRLRSVTPFTFIDFFAYKVDPSGLYIRYLVSHATQIILSTIIDVDFLNQCPSSMAAAAIICAASESQHLNFINPSMAVKWCIGLTREGINKCYRLMQEVGTDNTLRKTLKIVPYLRVTIPATSISSMSSSSSSSLSLPNKRRRLNNNNLDEDENKENSEK
ncbi:cyclin D1/2/4 plant protein [Dioscorea alata]|uniref:Cyclin D1/2/4 plant protein n=1 Tax=Dioscorea alata TaxID=55571 RepID=A0ACB7WLL7_DIOAL|nr:cyclin D1/2/4 plant protein [Dioscorea alata]